MSEEEARAALIPIHLVSRIARCLPDQSAMTLLLTNRHNSSLISRHVWKTIPFPYTQIQRTL
jgi:hypothetical protein